MRKIVFVMLVGIITLAACGGSESSSNANENVPLAPVPSEYAGLTNPLGADAAAEGAEVFRTNCEMCHGPQGHGDGPAGQALDPRPRDLAKLQTEAGDDFLFWRISERQAQDIHGELERNFERGTDLANRFFYSHIEVTKVTFVTCPKDALLFI
jgi:cytochrome c5